MTRARFVIADKETGEVLNAFIVESIAEWPPEGRTVTIPDSACRYQIGDQMPNDKLNEPKDFAE